MSARPAPRNVRAVHGRRKAPANAPALDALAAWLREQYQPDALVDLYGRHALGDDRFSAMMRGAIWAALARHAGAGLSVGSGVGFKHLETISLGAGVFIGAQAYLQGRFDGTCEIGNHVWIGPQSYFDARALVIEDYVGWGPGAKVLGSVHTGVPADVPIIQTDLEIKPVRICAWADVGTGAVILPGVTIGQGSIVGAGAVVTRDVPPFTIAAGVPARVIRDRDSTPGPRASHSLGEQEALQWVR
jgi:acetyltransferase-like isoleucine patch superfamily enzyme